MPRDVRNLFDNLYPEVRGQRGLHHVHLEDLASPANVLARNRRHPGAAVAGWLFSSCWLHSRPLVVSGLNGAKSKGSHSGAATRFLTGFGANSTAGAVLSSTSVDQLIARDFGRFTQLPSLELSLDGREEAGSCDAKPCGMGNTNS